MITSHMTSKGTCLFLPLVAKVNLGERMTWWRTGPRQNWALHRCVGGGEGGGSKQLIEPIFVIPSKPISEECFSCLPSSFSLTSFENTASLCLSLVLFLFCWHRWWPGGCCVVFMVAAGFFHSLRYFYSNTWVAHLLLPRLSPPCLSSRLALPPPQKNPEKLTSSRTGEIELYYFSFGNLTLLPLSESYHFLHLLARLLIDQWPVNAFADQ